MVRGDGTGPIILFVVLVLVGYFLSTWGMPGWLNTLGFIVTFAASFSATNNLGKKA